MCQSGCNQTRGGAQGVCRNHQGLVLVLYGKMKTEDENSADPKVHSEHLQQQLAELIHHARADIERVTEPRFQALLETTAEVLTGLKTAYRHYGEKHEAAWRDK